MSTNKKTMYSSIVKCSSCDRHINLSSGKNIYRSCDSYVCSPYCSKKRLKNISKIDPSFTNPLAWQESSPTTANKSFKKTSSMLNLNDYDQHTHRVFDPYTRVPHHEEEYEGDVAVEMDNYMDRDNENAIAEYEWSVTKKIGIAICGVLTIAFITL